MVDLEKFPHDQHSLQQMLDLHLEELISLSAIKTTNTMVVSRFSPSTLLQRSSSFSLSMENEQSEMTWLTAQDRRTHIYKGHDILPTTTTKRKRTDSESSSPTRVDTAISNMLKTLTPERVATKYFQRKYATWRDDSVQSNLFDPWDEIVVGDPTPQLSEDLMSLNDFEGVPEVTTLSEDEGESDAENETGPTRRKRRRVDPVVQEAKITPVHKWQRAPCGRIVSVDKLRARTCCNDCHLS